MEKRSIHTDGLTTGYRLGRGSSKILHHDLNLELRQGELICLLGLNGTGKSTLLRTLLGMEKPLNGDVFIDGKQLNEISIKETAKLISVVLTDKIEDHFLTAFEVALTGRYPYGSMTGRLSQEDKRIVEDTFLQLSISHLSDAVFQKLSDGEKQRVLIARAIVQQTPFIFMDEPVAFVDSPGKIGIMHLIKQLAEKYSKGVLIATHDLESALNYGDKLWLLGYERSFEEGSPAHLVNSGSFNKFFDRENVTFDIQSRRFIFKNKTT